MSCRQEICWTLLCDACGDGWAADFDSPPHFATVQDAQAFATAAGWVIDDETATCSDCALRAACAAAGHRWSQWEPFDAGTLTGDPRRRPQLMRECQGCAQLDWQPAPVTRTRVDPPSG